MPHPNDDQRNAAWQAAHQWRERAAQTRPDGLMGTIKLFFTWLAFGALLIIGLVLGLMFLLVGWAMMPFVRHKMKKRMEAMRAHQAQDIGSGHAYRESRKPQDVLEGHYEVKDKDRSA
ncbi:hypothetical protein GLV89_04040 [Halomonas alkaliantarctica]|nr:hypothetical protein [Halomonas alkaliantarctica]